MQATRQATSDQKEASWDWGVLFRYMVVSCCGKYLELGQKGSDQKGSESLDDWKDIQTNVEGSSSV